MRRMLVGVLVGMALAAPPLWALRFARPPTFTEWDSNTFSQLNDVLLQIWNAINGRIQFDVVTSDPDGSRRGNKAECVLYDPGATEEWCCNVDGATDWDCEALEP